MDDLTKSFNKLLLLEKKAKDIYEDIMKNDLDNDSLSKINWIRQEEIEHIRKAKFLVALKGKAAKRKKPAVFGKKAQEYFGRDFVFKRNILSSINELINSRIETISFLGKLEQFSEADKSRQQLVERVVHDIKSPLALTNWITESLLTQKLTEGQKKMVKAIEGSNRSIISFVEDLLAVEELEQEGELSKADFDLVSLCSEVIRELGFLLETRGQKIIFETSRNRVMIKNNAKALKAVIYNLLTNASQYGLKNDIKLELKKTEKGVVISVSDKGIGIAEKEQKNIFKKFFRTQEAKKTYGNGSGLGLYLVKGLVGRIGAKIWFESKTGKGTVFYVALS